MKPKSVYTVNPCEGSAAGWRHQHPFIVLLSNTNCKCAGGCQARQWICACGCQVNSGNVPVTVRGQGDLQLVQQTIKSVSSLNMFQKIAYKILRKCVVKAFLVGIVILNYQNKSVLPSWIILHAISCRNNNTKHNLNRQERFIVQTVGTIETSVYFLQKFKIVSIDKISCHWAAPKK